jgi:hypothetical protein
MPGLITAALGLSGGYSSGSQTQNTSSTDNKTATGATTGSGTGTSTPTYSPAQGGLQQSLADALTAILSGTGYSPQVQALQTQSADQINRQYSGLSDNLNEKFASRGFGKSGASGDVQLQTELSREGAIANNNANFAGTALNQWNSGLAQALNFAFANPGTTTSTSATGTTSSNSTDLSSQKTTASGSSFGLGVGGGLAGH